MSATVLEIDVASEIAAGDCVGVMALARRFRVAPSTPFRWIQKGLPGGCGVRVRLEAVRRGKGWFTSEAAIKRFFSSLPISAPAAAPIRTPSRRDRDSARAQKVLNTKYGI